MKKINIDTLRKRILSIVIILATCAGMLYATGFYTKAAESMYKTGQVTFFLNDSYGQSYVTIRAEGPTFTSSKSNTYRLSVKAYGGPHAIWLNGTSVSTKKDNSGHYNILNIPIGYNQLPYTQLSSSASEKVGGYGGRLNFNNYNAANNGSSTLVWGLSDVTVARSINIQLHAVHMGLRTDNGLARGFGNATLNYIRPTYTVNFENGRGGTYGQISVARGYVIAPSQFPGTDPTKVGYHFDGWNNPGEIKANTTVSAYWIPKTTTYVYDPNGGTGTMSSNTINYGASGKLLKNQFTRTGHTFQGWSESSTGSLRYLDEDLMENTADEDRTIRLYAVWESLKDTYRFHPNGGSGTMEPYRVSYDTTVALPANKFQKEGYRFAGWSVSETSTTKAYDDCASVSKPADSLTNMTYDLYALWTPNTCRINYSKNHGKGTQMGESTAGYTNPSFTLPLCTYQRPGYVFRGWSTDPRGAKEYNNKATISVAPWIIDGSKTVTLYAVWEKEDANFNMDQVEKDEKMFTDSKKLKGGNGTTYHTNKTDSEYARQDEEDEKGYYSSK